ncbi:MAG TPA: single-stranded DNA-binding protein [Caldisericia bacterium]|nr:single-stranded DNA-binding protein [Caldisericia bacterium]HOL83147.1 single-stranded DNA-binding protein [Caldisericia bacterium]HON83432.1 single-stranded DNA-binding protein [Caldisericia bacterium]HPC56847.1 single-stranded DNA-binding protein [Caldisericia bacterium]HPP43515.1 single-stranded DNA-binding protein [Caldisericia bacterium]
MYNKIILIGRLTKDPESKYTPSGTLVSTFRLASGRVYTDKNGEKQEETLFINVITWGGKSNLAENVGKYLKKGSLVLVEGRLRIRNYETSDGSKKIAVEVIANTVKFLSKREEEGPSEEIEEPVDEEIPID